MSASRRYIDIPLPTCKDSEGEAIFPEGDFKDLKGR